VNKASARRVAADVRRIETPKRGGMRPTNTQLGCGFPPGFGLRQSSAALDARLHTMLRGSIDSAIAPLVGKRQKTAAVQNAIARLRPPNLIWPFVGRLRLAGKSRVSAPRTHFFAAKEHKELKENLLFLCAPWVLLWQSILVLASAAAS